MSNIVSYLKLHLCQIWRDLLRTWHNPQQIIWTKCTYWRLVKGPLKWTKHGQHRQKTTCMCSIYVMFRFVKCPDLWEWAVSPVQPIKATSHVLDPCTAETQGIQVSARLHGNQCYLGSHFCCHCKCWKPSRGWQCWEWGGTTDVGRKFQRWHRWRKQLRASCTCIKFSIPRSSGVVSKFRHAFHHHGDAEV